jgi:hypothetical protein
VKKEFSEYLEDVILPTEEQKQKEFWDISGVLKGRSNEHLKFDIRPMFNYIKGGLAKKGNMFSKADKMVFEEKNSWIMVDVKELIQYIKNNKINIVQLEDLINKLEWNIILSK